ncbi:MAG: response regulator transcription factor [Prosthecobacter sp.]|jgi:DNA-binding NarL/FixJ family response regulator|uniref:response regulator n=1 Tax=Prosthecobacter sp. TaxID=1965333 RepID=UPI0019F6E9EE|nr:response regulator transcription factor [Prosthecobacter sp.]MBE2287038.1 response regulator transcription factor [Prosthecobacter sp.]
MTVETQRKPVTLPPQPLTNPLRLAVVDDHAIIRGVFVTLVEDAPDMVMAWTASSLTEARDKLHRSPPDFLVMDVSLPDGNGFSFTQEILAELPKLPVLIVSAKEDQSYPERAAACGARGFIPKEASLEQLVEAVTAIQQGRNWFPA